MVDACSRRVGEPRLGGPQPDAALALASLQSGACRRLGARTRLCVRAFARAPAGGPREALGSQWGGAPRAEGGAMTRAPRDPARGLRPRKPEAAAVSITGWGWRGGSECLGVSEPRNGSGRDSRVAEVVASAAAATGAAAMVVAGSGRTRLGQQPSQSPLRPPVGAAVAGSGGLVPDPAAGRKAGAAVPTP